MTSDKMSIGHKYAANSAIQNFLYNHYI